MNFDSWQPEDSARRFATLLACCVGVFAFMALWMAVPLNFFLALPAGGAIGGVMFAVTYPLFLAFFRR